MLLTQSGPRYGCQFALHQRLYIAGEESWGTVIERSDKRRCAHCIENNVTPI
jgi:hypothetical protein